MHTVVLDSQ